MNVHDLILAGLIKRAFGKVARTCIHTSDDIYLPCFSGEENLQLPLINS